MNLLMQVRCYNFMIELKNFCYQTSTFSYRSSMPFVMSLPQLTRTISVSTPTSFRERCFRRMDFNLVNYVLSREKREDYIIYQRILHLNIVCPILAGVIFTVYYRGH